MGSDAFGLLCSNMRALSRCLGVQMSSKEMKKALKKQVNTSSCRQRLALGSVLTPLPHMVQAQERKKREKLQEKERKKQEKLQKKQDKKKGKGSPEAPEDPNQVCSSLPPLCCISGLVVDVCDLSSRDLCIFLVPHSRAQRRTKSRRRRSRPSGRSQRTFSQPQPQPHLTRSRSTRRRPAPLPGCFMLRIMPPPSLR